MKAQLKQRCALLQDAFVNKMNLDSELAELKRSLTHVQDELTLLSRSIGHREEQTAASVTKAQVCIIHVH